MMERRKIDISDEEGRTRITRDNLNIIDEMTDEEAKSVFG